MVDNIPAYTLRITPSDYDPKLNPLIDKILGSDSGYVASILKRIEYILSTFQSELKEELVSK